MRKIIQRTRGFEKALKKLDRPLREKFLKKLKLFIDDEHHPTLRTHQLQGTMQNQYAFSISYDVRVIYCKEIQQEQEILTFTFINIGSHSKVYGCYKESSTQLL